MLPLVLISVLFFAFGSTQPCVANGYTNLTATTGATMPMGTTKSALIGDDETINVTLPFAFWFNGTSYSYLIVSSNGNVQFTSANEDSSIGCLPNSNFVDAIFVLGLDLDLNQTSCPSCGIFTAENGVTPNRNFVIEWRAIDYQSQSNAANFSLVLYESSGNFDIFYGSFSNATFFNEFATVGFQIGDGSTIASQYACQNVAGTLAAGTKLSAFYGCTNAPTAFPTTAPTVAPTTSSAASMLVSVASVVAFAALALF